MLRDVNKPRETTGQSDILNISSSDLENVFE